MKEVKDMNEKEKDALKELVYVLHKDWYTSITADINFTLANPNRDFYLRFTTLVWEHDWKWWRFKTLLEFPGSEVIYDPNVKYADKMDVTLESWKNNWDECSLYGTREVEKGEIPLYLLYEDFKAINYQGHCYMR